MQKIKLGSVSSGTLRIQDLIPRFLEVLADLDGDSYQEFLKEIPESAWIVPLNSVDENSKWWGSEHSGEVIEDIVEALNILAPPYVYFGSSLGDGADFGFWVEWDELNENIGCEQIEELTYAEHLIYCLNKAMPEKGVEVIDVKTRKIKTEYFLVEKKILCDKDGNVMWSI